ncbi:MAG: ion channel [Saprospiraceae bacterium]
MNFNLPFRNKVKEADNLGFGTRITANHYRMIDKNGAFNVEKTGTSAWAPYQDLVEMSWGRFFLVVVAVFVLINAVFAVLLLLFGADCLDGVQPGALWAYFTQAWYFSVQTFTTVGYGSISPVCTSTNLIASAIALVGLLSFALATGLIFARFSKPVARIVFSKVALIAPYKKETGFMFRFANSRHHKLINLEAKLTMSWVEKDQRGDKKRRYARLPLEVDKIAMMPLSWTIVHPIDSKSPLHEKTAADLEKMNLEIIVLVMGFDESFSQFVHANYSYCDEDLLWGKRFKMMYYPGENGKTVLNLDMIDEVMEP